MIQNNHVTQTAVDTVFCFCRLSQTYRSQISGQTGQILHIQKRFFMDTFPSVLSERAELLALEGRICTRVALMGNANYMVKHKDEHTCNRTIPLFQMRDVNSGDNYPGETHYRDVIPDSYEQSISNIFVSHISRLTAEWKYS